MRPLFTSRKEWDAADYDDEGAYVRDATGHVVRACLLGFLALVGPVGAIDPYWRSLPILGIFALCLAAGAGLSALLFRREWRAALRTYGIGRTAHTTAKH